MQYIWSNFDETFFRSEGKWNWQNIVLKYFLSETIHIQENGSRGTKSLIPNSLRACAIVQCVGSKPTFDCDSFNFYRQHVRTPLRICWLNVFCGSIDDACLIKGRSEKLDKSLNGSFQHSAFVVQSNYLKQSLFWSGFCFLGQFKRNSVKWDTGTNKKIGQFNDKYKNQGHIESSIYLLEWFI